MWRNGSERKKEECKKEIDVQKLAEILLLNSTEGKEELEDIMLGSCEDIETEMLLSALKQLSFPDIDGLGLRAIKSVKGERIYSFGNDSDGCVFYIRTERRSGKTVSSPCYHTDGIYVTVSSINEAIICGEKA